MATEVIQDDLAWDYSADESSPLLRRAVSPHGRRDRPCSFTNNQAQYLLHILCEATQILRSEMFQRTPEDGRTTETSSSGGRLLQTVFRLHQRVRAYLPVLIILIQIITIFIETVIDACLASHTDNPHKPYTSAVFISLSVLLLIFLYVDLLKRILHQRVTVLALMLSYFTSFLLFASIYTVFYRFDDSGWVFPLKISHGEFYVVTFLRMVHTSISVFTFCNDASGLQVLTWYPLVMLSIQMLLAYCHLVMIIVVVLNLMQQHPTFVTPDHPAECPQLPRDADTESITFGTHLNSVLNSRPVAVNHARRNSPHSNADEAGAALLSNSI